MSSSLPSAPAAQPWLPQTELAALHSALTRAEQSKIVKLLALADTLQNRGAVDDLIAPFRKQLAQLRPSRPLRFVRLLFMPLDPLIVPTAAWKPKLPSIPRCALLPLAEAVSDTMGEEAARIRGMVETHTTHDRQVIAEAGSVLWPSAAQALKRCPTPTAWTQQTGLPDGLFPTMATGVGAVLEHILTLQTWRAEAQLGGAVRTTAVQQVLQQVNKDQPEAVGMFIALVLARLPKAVRQLRAAISEIGGIAAIPMRAAMDGAIASLLERLEAEDGIETVVLGTTLREAGTEVCRVVELMGCVDAKSASPAHMVRMATLRRRLDESCRLRFTIALQNDFLQVLEALDSDADAAAVIRLEGTARGLRELGDEARRVGSPGTYDNLLRQTTDAIKAIGSNGAFTLADKVRLVEILAGPDEAWALLENAAA